MIVIDRGPKRLCRAWRHLYSAVMELSGYRTFSICPTEQPANILISSFPFKASGMPGMSRISFSIQGLQPRMVASASFTPLMLLFWKSLTGIEGYLLTTSWIHRADLQTQAMNFVGIN